MDSISLESEVIPFNAIYSSPVSENMYANTDM